MPDWLLVILLTVVLLLLGSRILTKALRMRAAESSLLGSGPTGGQLTPALSAAKSAALSPFELAAKVLSPGHGFLWRH